MRLSELNDTSSAAEGKIKSLLLFCGQCREDLNHTVLRSATEPKQDLTL